MEKRFQLHSLIITLIFIFLYGCSTTGHIKGKDPRSLVGMDEAKDEKVIKKFHDQLEEAEKTLSHHVDSILKKNNPDEVKFYASDLYLKAADSSIRGDSQIAVLLYKYVLKLSPYDLFVKKKYAVELIRTGDLDEALRYLNEVYAKGKRKDENIGLVIGGVYTALNKKNKARRTYRQVLKKNPKNVEACIFLAKSYLSESKFKKVDQILSRCEKRVKGEAGFSYYKGKIALNRADRKKARKYFKRALKIDPKYFQAAIALGVMHEEKEQYNKAKIIYKNFLKKNPDNYEVLSRIVQILFLKEKSRMIIPYMERLSNLDPTDLNSKVKLGVLYTDVKEYHKAKGVFREILVVVPDSDKVLYYLGSLCQELGEYEEAIEYYTQISPTSELFRSGNIEIAKMLYVKATPQNEDENKQVEAIRLIKFVEDRTALYPHVKVDLYFNLATYYENIQEFAKAIELISDIKNQKEYTQDHDYYLASLYEKKGDYDTSREIVTKMIEQEPNNAHALNFLGYSYLENSKDWEMAFNYISKAIKLKPDDGYIRDSLGWYYFKMGKYKKALVELKKAHKMERYDSVINQHLAIVYQKMKYYDKAKKYFVEALKNCKDNTQLKNQIVEALENLKRVRLPASK